MRWRFHQIAARCSHGLQIPSRSRRPFPAALRKEPLAGLRPNCSRRRRLVCRSRRENFRFGCGSLQKVETFCVPRRPGELSARGQAAVQSTLAVVPGRSSLRPLSPRGRSLAGKASEFAALRKVWPGGMPLAGPHNNRPSRPSCAEASGEATNPEAETR
jgi:hypothetical protein